MKERQFSVLIATGAPEDRAAMHDALSRDPAIHYVIIEAESSVRAIEARRAREPDCLILDLELSDSSGLEALKELAAEGRAPACALVALVGSGDVRLAAEAMEHGAHVCLEKDRARGEELRRAVSRAIEKANRQWQAASRVRELGEKNRALEASLTSSRREAAGREQGQEAWQAARAGVGSQRVEVSGLESVFNNQAEEQLRLLKTAIEQSNESVIITTGGLDPQGPRIVYVNPAFTKMTGYAPEEVIGKTPGVLQGLKTDSAVLDQLRKDCAAGKVFHGEMISYRKDRTEFFVEWSARPVRDVRGEVTHFAAALRDVTERRRMEEELRRGEKEFQSLFELSTIGMAQVSRDHKFLRVNRKLCQMLGYSERELLGLTFLDVTHPDDREISAAQADAAFAGEVAESSFEKRYVRKDGGIIWASVNWTVIPDAEERPARTVTSVQDVTERKRIEEALRTSEAQLRDIFDHSVALIFVKDLEGRYLRVNRRYAELFGSTDVELEGKTDYDCHPKEIADAFIANDREVIAADRPLLFEEKALVAGEIRYSIVSKFPLRDEGGRPYAICGIATEITERKRAETALRESQALNQAVLDSLAANIAVLDRDGNIIAVNEDWRRFARENGGAAIADSLGVNYLDVCRRAQEQGNGQIEATLKGIQEVLDGARPNFTVEYPCHSPNEKRWFLMSVTPLLGEGGGAVVAHTDITQRKQVEESLRVSEARLDLALKAGNIGTFDWDIRANKTIWTEQLKALFGLPPDGAGDTYETWLERVLPEDRAACEAGLREILERKLPRWRTEYRIVRADTSEVRWIDSKGRVFYDEQGEPLRFIGTNMDITERKQAEAAREELLVREQTAREAAEALSRAKDEFLTVISHELRSPLTAILGYAALLRHGGLDAQKVRHTADVIERSGKAQLQLIEDLLDTARIISGKLRLELGPVDLVLVIEQAVQTIRPAADAKGISIETDLPSEIGQITGDPARLQQVVWNLLSNAVKFTQQGGRVEARLERIDPHICITVSDTGKGIRSDFLPYVFDRFRQADASSARRYGGLGLGLSLVKYLVELHGGTISPESAGEGQGSTFKVVLPVRAVSTPLDEAQGALASCPEPQEAKLLDGVRALVVDDQEEARELVQLALSQYGAEVVAAGSAAEAYAIITATPPRERPDVMVIDIGMPGENGYDLVRRLRMWERDRGLHIPAVALTAYGRVEDRMRALNAGFQMHVTKPVEPAELATVIASLLRRMDKGEKT